MMTVEDWRFSLDAMVERLALGLDLFGPYADWLLAIPVLWGCAVLMIFGRMRWQQHRSDRAYLDYASRQLPILQRIARQRAVDVAYSRRTDRF